MEVPYPAASTFTVSSWRESVPDSPSSVMNSFSRGSRASTDSMSLLLLSRDTAVLALSDGGGVTDLRLSGLRRQHRGGEGHGQAKNYGQ